MAALTRVGELREGDVFIFDGKRYKADSRPRATNPHQSWYTLWAWDEFGRKEHFVFTADTEVELEEVALS